MQSPLPVQEVVDEWLAWATSQSDLANQGEQNESLIGFDEFYWIVRKHPEHAWK